MKNNRLITDLVARNAYDEWDIDPPEPGEDDPFEGWGND